MLFVMEGLFEVLDTVDVDAVPFSVFGHGGMDGRTA